MVDGKGTCIRVKMQHIGHVFFLKAIADRPQNRVPRMRREEHIPGIFLNGLGIEYFEESLPAIEPRQGCAPKASTMTVVVETVFVHFTVYAFSGGATLPRAYSMGHAP